MSVSGRDTLGALSKGVNCIESALEVSQKGIWGQINEIKIEAYIPEKERYRNDLNIACLSHQVCVHHIRMWISDCPRRQ